MSGISTHVLDTARGCPAAGIPVRLETMHTAEWQEVGTGTTDADGRVKSLLSVPLQGAPYRYRITFDLADYHAQQGVDGFFPRATVEFIVQNKNAHHHVPLLLSPFGYSTYRGS
jgi:5-hydroxyisourate hydrolase